VTEFLVLVLLVVVVGLGVRSSTRFWETDVSLSTSSCVSCEPSEDSLDDEEEEEEDEDDDEESDDGSSEELPMGMGVSRVLFSLGFFRTLIEDSLEASEPELPMLTFCSLDGS
jgi:hypothetical protein